MNIKPMRVAVVLVLLIVLGTLYALLGVPPLYGQGVSMGGHYAAEGEHPRVFWTLEVRSPKVGPVELAVTHSALKQTGATVKDRTDFTLLASPDWTVRPVLVGGFEATREWVEDDQPELGCGGGEQTGFPPCQQEWYTGGVFGVGLSADVAGGRIDVRYLRHPAAPTANGALIFLVGVDL